MSKKTKKNQLNKRRQKKLQVQKNKRKLKSMERKNEVVSWDSFEFLKTWNNLKPEDLMYEAFRLDLIDWIDLWLKPRRNSEIHALNDDQACFDLMVQCVEDYAKFWHDDSNGFTSELVPLKFRYSDDKIASFIEISKQDFPEWNDELEQEAINLAKSDHLAWFLTLHSGTINDIAEKIAAYVSSQIRMHLYNQQMGML